MHEGRGTRISALHGGEPKLDSLARALAGGEQSRRQLLKGAAAAVAGGAFSSPLWAWTDPAAAKKKHCPHGHAACNGGCCTPGQVCVTPKAKHGAKHKPKPHCECLAPRKQCRSGCIEVSGDPHNCGACGHTCTAPSGGSATCSGGKCKSSCHVAGDTICGSTCVNLQTDASNCGSCGHACPSGQVCSQGQCMLSCPSGEVACGTSCVSLQSDAHNCGSCGNACPTVTGGTAVCNAGVCGTSCDSPGASVCNGTCVDTTSDTNNCGSCGKVCAAGQACVASQCVGASSAGAACTSGDECASGVCAGGFCCVTQCATEAPDTCGTTGNCAAGTGACEHYSSSTTCAAATCSNGTASSARHCDGAGTCVAATTTQCTPYLCNGTICGTSCSSPADCVSGYTCTGGQCVPQAGNCSSGSDCMSGICLTNCCTSACAPSVGGCAATSCDASGACVYPTCANGVYCDGSGYCF